MLYRKSHNENYPAEINFQHLPKPDLKLLRQHSHSIATMNEPNTITLIDDDPISHLINSRMIKLFSTFEVESFTSPIEALQQLSWRATNEVKKFPEYILLDIHMPDMNGWQFLEEFEKLPDSILKRSCVIMLSSSMSMLDIEKSRQYKSVKQFISKPLTEDKINLIKQSCN
jgi:CheY-like chemotaxis protein